MRCGGSSAGIRVGRSCLLHPCPRASEASAFDPISLVRTRFARKVNPRQGEGGRQGKGERWIGRASGPTWKVTRGCSFRDRGYQGRASLAQQAFRPDKTRRSSLCSTKTRRGLVLQVKRKHVSQNHFVEYRMGCRFHLELNAEGHETVVCDGEFTDDEAATLELYLQQYEAVAASPALSSGLSCNMQINWDQDAGTVRVDLPDEDTLSVLLHRLRPFILANEPASYLTVSSIIGRRVDTPPVRDLLKRQRREYDGRAFQESVVISINDIVVNSERTLMDWLNSHEYHRDPDKREAVAVLLESFSGDFARGVFVNMLIDKMRACGNLAALVAVLLGKQKTLTFRSHEGVFESAVGSD